MKASEENYVDLMKRGGISNMSLAGGFLCVD